MLIILHSQEEIFMPKSLKSKNVTASATSGGDIECYASDRLSTHTSSGGDIRYAGNPRSIEGKSDNVSKL